MLDFIPLKTHAPCGRAKVEVGDIIGLGDTSPSMTPELEEGCRDP